MNGVPGYYDRQLRLPEVGLSGQERLAEARVVVVGLGALGSPAASYLVRAGVGTVHLVDGDRIEGSNLHRQPLYDAPEVGSFKADRAARRLSAANPHVQVVPHRRYVGPESGLPQSEGDLDLVLDCTDRFSSRFAIHDLCQARRIPLVSAAVSSFTGQLYHLPFARQKGPCLRCVYPQTPADGCTGSCAEDGILGASAGVMGSLQALLALRLLLGLESVPAATMHTIDLATLQVHAMSWEPSPSCPSCGGNGDTGGHEALRPAASVPIRESEAPERHSDATILDVRTPGEAQELDRLLVPGARPYPLDDLYASLETLDRDAPYVIICEHGVRSRRVLGDMKAMGFRHVSHLEGGFARLREAVCSE